MSKKKLTRLYFIGQFVIAVIALIGGGYVINAGSDLPQAAIFPRQLSIQDIAPDKFSDFKRTVLRPEVRRICIKQVADRFAGNAKPAAFASDFCDCYVQHVTDAVTKDDMVYLEQFKEPSPDMESRMDAVRQSAREQCHS